MEKKRDLLVETFLDYNSKINLSAIRTEDEVYTKHILDTLELKEILHFKPRTKVVDIWTGGGFPLLPLAIENPEIKFTGIEARRKKVNAVNKIISDLDIKNTKVLRHRIEEFRWTFDYLTARAVGYVDKLLDRSRNLVRKWWYFILYKQKSEEELETLNKICQQKKLKLITTHEYSLFEGDIDRVIYILQK